jgi:hypothetical protein
MFSSHIFGGVDQGGGPIRSGEGLVLALPLRMEFLT